MQSAIDDAKLYEYYVFDVQASVKAVATALESNPGKASNGEELKGKSIEQLAEALKSSDLIKNFRAYSGRYATKVDSKLAAAFIQAAYPNEDTTSLASRWGRVLDVLNVDLYAECNDDVKTAMDGVVGRLRYTRLDAHGPKMGEINEK